MPRPNLGRDHDRELDRASRRGSPASGEREQLVDEPLFLGVGRRPPRDRENVDVAVRPQPTEGGRTVEVRADEIGVKDVAQSSEDMLDLPPLRGGKGTRHAPVPYDAANPGWDPFVKRFR
jgi:hypothetical protein